MREKLIEYSLFTVAGIVLLIAVELKFIHINELFTIIIGFVGFVALLHGAFGLYNTFKS